MFLALTIDFYVCELPVTGNNQILGGYVFPFCMIADLKRLAYFYRFRIISY